MFFLTLILFYKLGSRLGWNTLRSQYLHDNDSHITWEGLTNKEAVTRRTFSTIRQVKIRNSDFKFDFVMVIICTSFELTRHFNVIESTVSTIEVVTFY